MNMEQSRQELLEAADQCEADAVAHERNARVGAAAESRDQAERLRAQADGAPTGPSPESIDAAVSAVREKLAAARDLISQGVETYLSCEDAIVNLFVEFGGAPTEPATEAAKDGATAPSGEGDGGGAAAPPPEPFTFDIEASVPDLLEKVGDDPEKAQAVLDAENASSGPNRSTLVEPLTAIIDAATKPPSAS